MLENSLAKTHYIGRDGYVWWIGQIPKEKNWISNVSTRPTESNDEFNGFDYRYKVRIIGYHPADKNELADKDLPWATVLFPVTAGSGQGGASQSPNLRQGMFVQGFFLDGEDGQQPIITGVFSVNQYAEVARNSEKTDFFKLVSGTNSVDDILNRSGLPFNQEQANTDKVAVESVIGWDQIFSGADNEAYLDSYIEERVVKTTDCDLARLDSIQNILKNALNKEQRLKKTKADFIF